MYRKTYVEIDTNKFYDNVKYLKEAYSEYEYLIAVIKANAYGHNDAIIEYLIKLGISYFAVSSLEEALSARAKNDSIAILCLEPIDIVHLEIASSNNITITIHDINYFKEILTTSHSLIAHLKVDSGMNRLGIKNKQEIEYIVNNLPQNMQLEGIYTHIGNANSEESYTRQLNVFKNQIKNIDLTKIKIIHLGNSACLINYPKEKFINGVRMGAVMYGINTSIKDIPLKVAFSLYSHISQIKHVIKGEYIGYDGYYQANSDMIIGIIPIGYADGFIKKNQNDYVAINNKKYKIVGSICMDMTMIEIDDTIHVDDKVELIGDNITIADKAIKLETNMYEVVCGISDRVPRIYFNDNKVIKELIGRF